MNKTKTNTKQKNALKVLIEAQAEKPRVLTYGSGETELIITVSPVISFTKRSEMIRFIIDGVFTTGIDTIHSYTPEYEKLAKRYAVLQYYTDLKIPSKLNDLWMILNHTTIYDDVIAIVGKDIEDIFYEADCAIVAKRDYLVHKTDINSLFEKIGSTVGTIGKDFSKEDLTSILDTFKKMPNLSENQMIEGIFTAQRAREPENN